ncbi:UNVERIFIED_CONTAM: hypothetical protein K2H54_046076 [Gekko kuhli]
MEWRLTICILENNGHFIAAWGIVSPGIIVTVLDDYHGHCGRLCIVEESSGEHIVGMTLSSFGFKCYLYGVSVVALNMPPTSMAMVMAEDCEVPARLPHHQESPSPTGSLAVLPAGSVGAGGPWADSTPPAPTMHATAAQHAGKGTGPPPHQKSPLPTGSPAALPAYSVAVVAEGGPGATSPGPGTYAMATQHSVKAAALAHHQDRL